MSDILAPVIRRVIAPAWAVWERSPYLRHYKRLKRTQFDPPEAIRRRQWECVQSLLVHAYRTTRFYRARLQAAGIIQGRIRSLDDLRAIPLLTKTDLRERQDDLLSDDYRNNSQSLLRKKTSGSTGVSVEVLLDERANQFKRACTLRSDEWSGWRFGQRVAVLWGAEENQRRGLRAWLRNRFLQRSILLDTLRITEDNMTLFLMALRRHPPGLLLGHAHSLYLFAQFVKSRGGPGFQPRGIVSAAMVLHDRERRAIEEVFCCPATNRYGCEEVSLIACECDRHDGLHVNADGIYLEVLRPDGTPCGPGEPGMIVITDLTNWAMPIIRYQIGDMGVTSDRHCPCGRGLPLLERIEGRVADYVLTPRGELVSGISLTDHFNTKIPGVVQLQIIQEAVDRFLFRIVKGPGFDDRSLETIGRLTPERFGPEVRHECEFLACIPQEPSGKYRFCISKVKNPFCVD